MVPLDKGLMGLPLTLNPNTKRLTINNAQTSQLTNIESVDKLKSLDLALNKLTLIDFNDISQNTVLTFFNSSHNNISELRDSMVTNLLIEIDISMHNFDGFNERMEADLRKKLVKINVENFDLSHNSLTTLRNLTFIRWHKLSDLDLSFNHLSILETHSLFGLTNLEKINLRANRLVQLPSIALQGTTRSVFNLIRPSTSDQSSLEYLDMSGNMFIYVDSYAFRMVGRAKKIYLESCSIQSISDHAFEGLGLLQTLSLDRNYLQKIPSQSFNELGSLKVLTLNENNISFIGKNSFADLVGLQELQLSQGSVRELEAGAFIGLSNLQKLKISHNPSLTRIKPGTFENLASLTFLDLQSNSLPYVTADVSHDSLALIDLRRNPLECGCDLRWLTTWLRRINETLQVESKLTSIIHPKENSDYLYDSLPMGQILNLTCSGPPALAGQPVIDLPISKLECLEPSSEVNVLIGYIALFAISTILLVICMTNFVQNKKQLLTILKDNLVQNRVPVVSPYMLNLHKNVDNLKKETQLYNSDYDNIDYGPHAQIYSVQGDQIMYYGPQQQYSQQI